LLVSEPLALADAPRTVGGSAAGRTAAPPTLPHPTPPHPTPPCHTPPALTPACARPGLAAPCARRAKYNPDEKQRSALVRARRHLHEVLIDQLPCLRGLQGLLDALLLGADPAPCLSASSTLHCGAAGAAPRMCGGAASGSGRAAALILEQVPQMREAVPRACDWAAVAKRCTHRLSAEAAQLTRARAERMLKSFELLCSLEECSGDTGGAAWAKTPAAAAAARAPACPGAAAGRRDVDAGAGRDDASSSVRVECWRRVRAGVHERWCEFDCAVDPACAPEAVTVAGEGGAAVHGVRRRLADMHALEARPLPCDGKVGAGRGRPRGGLWVGPGSHASAAAAARQRVAAKHAGREAGRAAQPGSPSIPPFVAADCGALAGAQGRGAAAAAERRRALARRHAPGRVADGGPARD
jgi:hypothetical protein